ncbi:MAG TPA: hypothetical protein VEB88_03585 [Candidatus Acidoferrales bacterium]|nr:hypothetical protein [Candidatus Acidoferrales bacterium]
MKDIDIWRRPLEEVSVGVEIPRAVAPSISASGTQFISKVYC